jgi:hypothetical protein
MEEASLDPLLAFSTLASEFLGRAVSACLQAFPSANAAYKKVTLELAQSAQHPGQIMLQGAHLSKLLNIFYPSQEISLSTFCQFSTLQ